MISINTEAVNRGTYPIKISFTDSNGDATLPLYASWSLTDSYGHVINNREDTPISVESDVIIVLHGDDLDIENSSVRYITVNAIYNSTTYGSNLTGREQATFSIGTWVEPEPTA